MRVLFCAVLRQLPVVACWAYGGPKHLFAACKPCWLGPMSCLPFLFALSSVVTSNCAVNAHCKLLIAHWLRLLPSSHPGALSFSMLPLSSPLRTARFTWFYPSFQPTCDPLLSTAPPLLPPQVTTYAGNDTANGVCTAQLRLWLTLQAVSCVESLSPTAQHGVYCLKLVAVGCSRSWEAIRSCVRRSAQGMLALWVLHPGALNSLYTSLPASDALRT